MVHEAKSAAKTNPSDIRQFIDQDLVLLVAPIRSKPKYNTVPRQVLLKAMCGIKALVSTQAAVLIAVVPHENVAKNHACITAEDIMDV